MNSRTLATLEQLKAVDWFSSVGLRDSDAVIVLNTWEEANGSCSGADWVALCNEAANHYRTRVAERSPDRLARWNELAREVKAITVPMVIAKTQQLVQEGKLLARSVDSIQWDVLHVGMEAEYADVFPPGFFASQAFWYLKGHLPCGWSGEFPRGKLVVF